MATLLEQISSRTVHVGIIGLGYVGLPLALRFTQAGVKVTGFDIDPDKPRKLHAGQSYTPSAPKRAPSARLRLAPPGNVDARFGCAADLVRPSDTFLNGP
ncbi:MAG: NAD(P)-binding domain-containing protein [Pseudomonadota bacterium]